MMQNKSETFNPNTYGMKKSKYGPFCSINDRSLDMHNPQELRDFLNQRIAQLESQREAIYVRLGRPNKVNINKYKANPTRNKKYKSDLLSAYFFLGYAIHDLNEKLKLLNSCHFSLLERSFEAIFVSLAKEHLSMELFNSFKTDALIELNKNKEKLGADWETLLKKLRTFNNNTYH